MRDRPPSQDNCTLSHDLHLSVQGCCLDFSLCLTYRMRKDPLSNIDNGTKVALAYQRITDPERAKKEAAKRKEAEAAAKKQAAEAAAPKKKGGAWGGLPSR